MRYSRYFHSKNEYDSFTHELSSQWLSSTFVLKNTLITKIKVPWFSMCIVPVKYTGTAYRTWVLGSSRFLVGSVLLIFLVFCVGFVLFCLSAFSYLCSKLHVSLDCPLLTTHRLPIRFSLKFIKQNNQENLSVFVKDRRNAWE